MRETRDSHLRPAVNMSRFVVADSPFREVAPRSEEHRSYVYDSESISHQLFFRVINFIFQI
jgi:hypothetical protein